MSPVAPVRPRAARRPSSRPSSQAIRIVVEIPNTQPVSVEPPVQSSRPEAA